MTGLDPIFLQYGALGLAAIVVGLAAKFVSQVTAQSTRHNELMSNQSIKQNELLLGQVEQQRDKFELALQRQREDFARMLDKQQERSSVIIEAQHVKLTMLGTSLDRVTSSLVDVVDRLEAVENKIGSRRRSTDPAPATDAKDPQ